MSKLFRRLFLKNSLFTIALRYRAEESLLARPIFQPNYICPARQERWIADPILAEADNKTWLFYEAVEAGRGHIEVAEVLPDCSLGNPIVILQDDCHYSYPFVFSFKGEWYMIPESCEAREVRLYRAECFPFSWSLQTVLLRERAVDTTVFEADGSLYLLTFLFDGSTERVHPQAYRMELNEEQHTLYPLRWEDYNELRVRGAGPIFPENGELIRPAQENQEYSYGDGILFYFLKADAKSYSEELAGRFRVPLGRYAGLFVNGTHTYCRSSRFEAVDLRCEECHLMKLPQKLLRRFRA